MTPLSPPLDSIHVENNKVHFGDAKYQPEKVLQAQRNLWATLGVRGASQKTEPENFLIIGEPFHDDDGTVCSKVFNDELFNPYKEPCLTTLSSSDTCSNVKKLSSGLIVWKHVGDKEDDVRAWYAGVAAEAKDGRVLFNLHYKDAWEALFHEPVHEAAPDGGIGTSPRWTYEGYCEIFAKQLAASMGYAGYSIDAGPYRDFAHNVQKLIDFTSETYVARAYFVNDEWSYGLLAPLWYKFVLGHDISGDIAQYIPADVSDVPSRIKDLLTAVKRKDKPGWYKRWVRLFGCNKSMPVLSAVPPIRRPGLSLGKAGMPLPTQGGHETEVIDLTFNKYSPHRRFWTVDENKAA